MTDNNYPPVSLLRDPPQFLYFTGKGERTSSLRLRGILTHGDEATEFGEKPSAQRVELRLRWYL